ncbi:MAG: hypothetical protein ABIE74_03775 [Pseudomonadota bacterium]
MITVKNDIMKSEGLKSDKRKEAEKKEGIKEHKWVKYAKLPEHLDSKGSVLLIPRAFGDGAQGIVLCRGRGCPREDNCGSYCHCDSKCNCVQKGQKIAQI